MLVPLFRKCCILWKRLSYLQHIIWLFLLVLLSQHWQRSDGKPTKWNHSCNSIQRRFMWKQMDSTVDGFVDRVVTGARIMKSMIGDFMPPKHSTSNVMDYLPTETTRIRYIIRNPHTKELKVIRIRPSKKVVKLMAITPKPLLADKPKPIHMNYPEHMTDKLKQMHIKDPDMLADKFKPMYIVGPDKLRQLEKEQELIAEGRIPIKSETQPIYMTFRAENQKDVDNDFNDNNNIVSGKIQDFNESWKPVYKLGDNPTGFTTSKPYMMSALHTSVVGELLPQPQKQVYEPLTSNDFLEEESKKSHSYEVTEYTVEESVIQPHTHDYYKHQSPSALPFTQQGESSLKHFLVTTATPNINTQNKDDSAPKIYHTIRTTTTTQSPNYPASFLKKIRNRPDIKYNSKVQQRNNSQEISLASSWLPSKATYTSQRARQVPYHQHLTSVSSPQKTNFQKWPPDAENTYLNSAKLSAYDISSTTEVPIFEEFRSHATSNHSSSQKNVRFKSPHYSSFGETKKRSVRHRGSVKYGEKLEIGER